MELTKVCRLCLAAADWPVDVFDELADKIAQCLQLRISRTDQLPKHVCVKCKDTVNDFHAYYTNTVECQKQLDQLVDVQQNMVSRRRRRIDEIVVVQRTAMRVRGALRNWSCRPPYVPHKIETFFLCENDASPYRPDKNFSTICYTLRSKYARKQFSDGRHHTP